MKKGDSIQGIVEKIVFPNKGIVMNGDEAVIVKNVIPGQMVKAVITKKRKGKSEGRLLEVLKKLPMNLPRESARIFHSAGAVSTKIFLIPIR